jgi:hypothetical protein
MATKWVITAPADHIELDGTQQGQTTFTVTNPSTRLDRVVFDIVTGDGADPAWFTVEEPQRRVPPSGSVSYLVKTAIPTTANAGTYSVQGRAYSADSAPEEDSVLSGRLAVDIKPRPAPPKKKRPWWILVVAALVVIVLAVVGVVVGLSGRGPKQVTVPELTHQSEAQARAFLVLVGLNVGTVRHVQSTTPNGVVYQSLPGGATVARGSAVDLVATASLAAPVLGAPPNNGSVAAGLLSPPVIPMPVNGVAQPSTAPRTSPSGNRAASGVLRWSDPDPFIGRWLVTIQQEVCLSGEYVYVKSCYFLNSTVVEVDRPAYTPIIGPLTSAVAGKSQASQYPATQWWVNAVDDFGNSGPSSAPSTFAVS